MKYASSSVRSAAQHEQEYSFSQRYDTELDHTEAVNYYTMAAESHIIDAIVCYGFGWIYGCGVELNPVNGLLILLTTVILAIDRLLDCFYQDQVPLNNI